FAQQRELAELETQIGALEERQTGLQTKINAAGSDYQKMQQLAAELQTVEAELEEKMTRWLALQEMAEAADEE
ncbi:MAG: ABC transporter ATP-binding protein, partial [Chloroflexi bacterium]